MKTKANTAKRNNVNRKTKRDLCQQGKASKFAASIRPTRLREINLLVFF
jgi:hypothetical protein